MFTSSASKARFCVCCVVLVASGGVLLAAPAKTDRPSYQQVRDFLTKHTKVVELANDDGARVAICPELQGRVMTSSVSGLNGDSLGWVNRSFIEKGEPNKHFNNYGGEDRFWLGPEGGQFSLWFAPGAEQKLDNWLTPTALNDGAFEFKMDKQAPFYRLTRKVQVQNASKSQFTIDVNRDIHLLSGFHFGKLFGEEAQSAVAAGKLKMVGFQTVNTITNRGAALTKDKGLVSVWILGMFPPSPTTTIIVPYKSGDAAALGPVVKSDYFGEIPSERLEVRPDAILFKGDGNYRSKIGTSQRRGMNVAGSLDLENGLLTLVHFNMPDDPTTFSYVNNSWELPQKEPFVGDVFNSYNDGPPEPGKASLGGFYELESVSPAMQLGSGKTLTHAHTTFHLQGDKATLLKVVKLALGVELGK